MKVETYEIEEIKGEAGNLAADSEAMELCRSLELDGQLQMVETKTDTRFPYRQMTKLEMLVFRVHCPERTVLKDYKAGIIPVRVLQVAAYAKAAGVLHHMEVWHPENASLDPVLVGYKENYGGDLFLLARWGEVWKDFETLRQEAAAIIKARLVTEIQELRDRVLARLRDVDAEVQRALVTGNLKDAKSGYDY